MTQNEEFLRMQSLLAATRTEMSHLRKKVSEVEEKKTNLPPKSPAINVDTPATQVPATASSSGAPGGEPIAWGSALEPVDPNGSVAPPFLVYGGYGGEIDGGGDGCHILAIGQGDAQPSDVLGAGVGYMDPVMSQMIKNLKAPHFDERAENWPSFSWDFKEYLQILSPQKPILDAMKLRLFEEAMPPTLKGEVKLLRKASGGQIMHLC